MIEILVVMAITIILMGLIFGPIISSFNFVSRGRITARAQEAARNTLETINREVKDAVQVSVSNGDRLILPQDPDPTVRTTGVQGLGFIASYDGAGKAHPLNNALLDFLPADDTLGLHGGNLSNPPAPQATDPKNTTLEAKDNRVQPCVVSGSETCVHNIVVRYFVGLSDPGFPHTSSGDRWSPRTSSNPTWSNGNIQNSLLSSSNADNMYLLYRIEFDAEDPAFANWKLDPKTDSAKIQTYIQQGILPEGFNLSSPFINPNFFYDNDTSANGEPYWVNWRRNAQAVSPVDNIDLVRFLPDVNNPTQALSTVTFAPTVIQNDPAIPVPGQEGSPVSYVASHGNWSGIQNNGTLTATQTTPPDLGAYPHITVYQTASDRNGVNQLAKVYDNWITRKSDPASPDNTRVVTWDSRTGTVRFAAGARDPSNGTVQEVQVEAFANTTNGWEFDPVAMAVQQNKLTIPASLKSHIRIVPGSETVSITYPATSPIDAGGTTYPRTDIYRRGSNTQLMDTAPQPADWDLSKGPYPTALPEPGSYFFDPETGKIVLGFPWPGPNNPQRPQPIPPMVNGSSPRIVIRFAFQTNTPNDVVRVDYATRSLLNASIGMRAFDPSTGRAILSQLTDRIALRNVGR
jgi:hypothetical protein